ncbi:MAG TPA: outer membrane beta-barrel domain-containing protein [Steroidobacteraceae bacterium]|nr:outer membrane beta-barrel domain-containing protein [Steroidobacteraceae bacterium]
METWIRVFLLVPMLLGLQGCGLFGGSKEQPPLGAEEEPEQSAPAQTGGPTAGNTGPNKDEASEQPVIDPRIARRTIKVPTIDGQDFQVGAYVGILSIEDFGTNSVVGARFDYHVTESFFLEGSLGRSKGGTTSYERLSGGPQLLADDDRYFTYYALNVGWNALPGEIFIGKGLAMNSAFYFTVGMGGTEFAGDTHFTANAGMGYRILPVRFLAINFDFRDYLFDMDILGEKKVTHNLEGSLGLSFFF